MARPDSLIHSFPYEVIFRVFEISTWTPSYAYPPPPTYFYPNQPPPNFQPLISLSLVCRLWREAAQNILLSSPHLKDRDAFKSFLDLTRSGVLKASRVRHLTINFSPDRNCYGYPNSMTRMGGGFAWNIQYLEAAELIRTLNSKGNGRLERINLEGIRLAEARPGDDELVQALAGIADGAKKGVREFEYRPATKGACEDIESFIAPALSGWNQLKVLRLVDISSRTRRYQPVLGDLPRIEFELDVLEIFDSIARFSDLDWLLSCGGSGKFLRRLALDVEGPTAAELAECLNKAGLGDTLEEFTFIARGEQQKGATFLFLPILKNLVSLEVDDEGIGSWTAEVPDSSQPYSDEQHAFFSLLPATLQNLTLRRRSALVFHPATISTALGNCSATGLRSLTVDVLSRNPASEHAVGLEALCASMGISFRYVGKQAPDLTFASASCLALVPFEFS